MMIGFSLQTFFSIQHIRAAAYFARRAGRIERCWDGGLTGPMLPAIQSHVVGTIFATVAFLEATVNELFADAATASGGHLADGVGPDSVKIVASLGATTAVERAAVIEKFNILLMAAGFESLDPGTRPAQDVNTLIRLRNGLTHYEAAWFDSGTDDMVRSGSFGSSKLAKLINAQFAPRKHSTKMSADYWIGFGCAKWAVESSIAYTDDVFARLGVTAIYDHVRADLRVP